ncbi:hypothetical protein DL89DRAFT_254623 [Linderina pennispora]|uniref:F-box domain-containing protein n=1 Tax=Linderina pennispora TaxID=61395 RepID=A0A1Y1WN12_9FUNG|nr:uncharacterized protein DL89DRAFT_254623 [Linderina pennispora]ORX74852.1 hypothetical protein DL89DRAFT_254623 [Linderina pennispora]
MATGTDTISDMHPLYSLVPRMPLLRTLVSTATIPPELADIDQPLSTLYVCKSIPISTANRPWVVSQAISQSLTSLTMKNFSLRDILFLFRQSSADTTMSAFPNLRLLDLELSVLLHGDGNTDDFDQEHFELPSLTYLRLASDADLCVSFQRRIRYPQLLDLVIELPQRDTTVDFYLCDTPALRLLRVIGDTSRNIPEDPRCCDADLRPLLTICYNLHMLDLRVRRIPLPCLRPVNPSEDQVFVLQRLEIHFPIATEQLAQLLLCLPMLIHLSVAWCEHPRYPELALDSPTISPSLEIISVPSIFGVLDDVPFRRFAELTRHMPVLQTIRAPAMIANMIELAIWRNRRGMKDGALDMPQFNFVDSGAVSDS